MNAGPIEPSGLQEWRRHWPVIVPCFLGIMLIATHGYSLGVMIRPLEEEFGWPRAQISAGVLIAAMLALFAGTIVGSIVDRLGPRKIGLIGIPLYCASLAGLSLASDDILTWWLLWVILALSAMLVIPMVWLSVINGYFFKSRGLALAIALSGTGVSAALWPIVTNTLVEAYGWRIAYVGLGALGLVLCFPAALLLFRENPSPERRAAEAARKATPSAMPEARRQLGSMRFLKLAAAALIFALANGTVTQNMVPILISEGLTPAKAAATAGLLGIGSIIGRIVGGYLLDRFNGNVVAAVSVILPLVTVVLLLGMGGSQLWAGVACIAMGFAIGAELDCCAYLVGRHFGTLKFGTLFGTINGLLLFGTGISPIIGNYVYDTTRSYDGVMIAVIPAFLLTSILFLSLGDYRHLDPETGNPLDGSGNAKSASRESGA